MEKKSKVVELKAAPKKGEPKEENQKLTYEQLEQVANNLNNQCRQMYERIQELQSVISDFNDIELLLSIISKGENFGESFVERCCKRIEEIVTKRLDEVDKQSEVKKEEK